MFLKQLAAMVVLALGLLNTGYTHADKALDRKEKEIQKLLDQSRKEFGFTAMALTVIAPKISPQPMNFLSGTIKKGGRALQASDYFQIGSNSKSFVAATLLKLQSENKLSLQDSITRWLPQYPQWKEVTIFDLLHNNSGLKSYSQSQDFLKEFENNPSKVYTASELVDYAYKEPVLFKPAQGWDYSNTNWILAGMIAEKASGKTLAQLFNQYFLSPAKLNLKETIYWPYAYTNELLQHVVHGYDDTGKDTINRNLSWANAAGAILASNNDLAHWAYALFHQEALTPEELKAMQTLVSIKTGKPIKDEEGYGAAIGFRKLSVGYFWGHEGHTDGFHSIFAWFPQYDITIALQGNARTRESNYFPVLDKIVNILNKKRG